MKTALVLGGYGTFGSLVARELNALGVNVQVAGRDLSRAQVFAATLPNAEGKRVDLGDAASLSVALGSCDIVVNCAGPFSHFDDTLPSLCLENRRPYVDIADDRAYCAALKRRHNEFVAAGVTALFGCSSLPGISGALARSIATQPIDSAEVVLFIGNRNPKGSAALTSALATVGKEILAPQAVLSGFADTATVALPDPFGWRRVANFESPEYDLFPALLGARAVTVKVGFEFPGSHLIFRGLGKLGRFKSVGLAFAHSLSNLTRPFGRSGGVVQVTLRAPDGATAIASASCREDGQRMAALPCAWAAAHLLEKRAPSGVYPVYELSQFSLLERLAAAGFTVQRDCFSESSD